MIGLPCIMNVFVVGQRGGRHGKGGKCNAYSYPDTWTVRCMDGAHVQLDLRYTCDRLRTFQHAVVLCRAAPRLL